MVWAQLAAMSAGVAMDAYKAHAAKRQYKRAKKNARIEIEKIRSQDRLYGSQQQQALQRALQAAVGGYEGAEVKTSAAERSARREAVDVSKEEEGELQQRYGGGAGQTTAFDMARAGLSARTTRRLQEVDAAFSGMMGQLAIGKGQARAAGEQNLAAFQGQRAEQERNLNSKLFDIASGGTFGSIGQGLQSSEFQPSGTDASGIYDILKMFGGGGGGNSGVPSGGGYNYPGTFVGSESTG